MVMVKFYIFHIFTYVKKHNSKIKYRVFANECRDVDLYNKNIVLTLFFKEIESIFITCHRIAAIF